MTYKLWIRCSKGNALIQQAVPVVWCCAGVGWLTLPSANVLPFHGLDKCVQMPVVGKQQLYNGFAQAKWFREQWEASDAAKAVKTAFQRERVLEGKASERVGKGVSASLEISSMSPDLFVVPFVNSGLQAKRRKSPVSKASSPLREMLLSSRGKRTT